MDRGESHKIDGARRRGRGAQSNVSGRFEALTRFEVEDGWTPVEREAFRTDVRLERPRSAITRNSSPDVPFDRSINPYRGCEHGCIYCFARPSHAWLGLSPGLDFETQLVARPGIGAVLAREFGRKSYVPQTIAIGTNTDPYQPIEGRMKVMRELLEVLWEHRHPVGIVTKGTLIERDIDLLAPMAREGLVHVGVSVTTLEPDVSRAMEPRVPLSARRLEVIRRLSGAGIPVRIMVAPVVPGLTDPELEAILAAGLEAGAKAASWIMLRLPREVAGLFEEWLRDAYPDRAEKVLRRLREMHGGQLYAADWGKRMRGEGVHAAMVEHRFQLALRRLGLEARLPELVTDQFRRPQQGGEQLSLF